MEKMVILFDHILALVQARASFGSIGQGRNLARYCIYELTANMTNEEEKTRSLFSESQMSPGNAETSPTIVAPRPIDTKSAGRAQQMSVLIEVNKLKKEIQMFFCKSLLGFNFFYSVS